MIDRPDAPTLLAAMARTLSEEVLPSTSGPAQHAVRVVANLCRILEREFALGSSGSEQSRRALARLLDHDASLPELVEELDARLRDEEVPGPTADDIADESEGGSASTEGDFDERARRVILADVERRLAIDRPGYPS